MPFPMMQFLSSTNLFIYHYILCLSYFPVIYPGRRDEMRERRYSPSLDESHRTVMGMSVCEECVRFRPAVRCVFFVGTRTQQVRVDYEQNQVGQIVSVAST